MIKIPVRAGYEGRTMVSGSIPKGQQSKSQEAVEAIYNWSKENVFQLNGKKIQYSIDFVRLKCAKWEPSKSSVICSKHFKPDNLVRNYTLLKDQKTLSNPY